MWRYAMTKKQKSAKQIKKTVPNETALCHGRKKNKRLLPKIFKSVCFCAAKFAIVKPSPNMVI